MSPGLGVNKSWRTFYVLTIVNDRPKELQDFVTLQPRPKFSIQIITRE